MLIPLHVKSHYSLGFGTAPIGKLVERAAMLGLPAMGLTDIENLYGQVTFHQAARDMGLRPITGAELSASGGHGRLVLLARNRAGYENLSKIITCRKLGPEADLSEILAGRLEGLFTLTDSPPTLERFLSLASLDRKFARLLLVRPGPSLSKEREIMEASRRLEVPLVADPDIVFLDPPDRLFHRLKVAIGRNCLLSEVEEGPAGRHFPGPRECEELFADLPEAVREAERIAGECELELVSAKHIFPRIPLPPGEIAASYLTRISSRALEERCRRPTARHRERLRQELEIIERLGFSEYFIVVGDIVRSARERGIEVVGRGSGAGSLVAHLLGITNVDPLEYRLYFERFLHEGRPDLPDIDIDLCWIRRDEVIEHVYQAYGNDRVAMISSHNTFQPRSAFRETIKTFGLPMEEVNRWSRRLPTVYPDVTCREPLRELILSSPRSRAMPLDEEPFRSALPLAERLLNQPHHLSIHPGGIVIADRDLDAYVPLERAQKGIVVTQYDMYSIEKVGLVKIDLLGSRCLTELQETLDLVRGRPGGPSLRLADIPDADPRTLETLQSARTVGCFQLESPAMRSLLSKMRVRNIRDCIAAVAIIRPGAAAGAAKETYIRRANGEEPPRYLHPSLREILEESYGVVIYEEDVMCISSAIAGMSLAEGDQLRSAIKRCCHPDDFRELENQFLLRAMKHGIAPQVARGVWKELCRFAAYCFSKAHASGYGVLAYQSAYLKTHFPLEFGCALLNNHAGMYSTRTIAEEVKRMGMRLFHPSVDRSGARFSVEGSGEGRGILTGLERVKGLSRSAVEAIPSARRSAGPFLSLADFLDRVSISRPEVEALILSGAFDDLPPPPGMEAPLNQPQLLWELCSTPSTSSRGKGSLRAGGLLCSLGGRLDYPPLKDYSPLTRIGNELEFLGMAITDHPMRLLRAEARERGCLTTREAARQVGRRVGVAAILAATREVRTKRGEMMQFLTLEDECGLLEATLFPRAYRAFSARLSALGPYLVEGTVEEDHRAVNLNVSRVGEFGDRAPPRE